MDAIVELSALQQARGITGPVCEIGVHHGRLFILLHLLSAATERGLAIDLFEMQDENIDQSGQGQPRAVAAQPAGARLRPGAHRPDGRNSLRLTPERIAAGCAGRPRLFSIDGGRTAEATCNDLALADRSICDGGLVISTTTSTPLGPVSRRAPAPTCIETRAPTAAGGDHVEQVLLHQRQRPQHDYRRHLVEHHGEAKTSTVFGEPGRVLRPAPVTLRRKLTAHPAWLAVRSDDSGRRRC